MDLLRPEKGRGRRVTRPRIFLDSLPEPGDTRTIDDSRSHYLKNVLRLKEGEEIVLSDGRGAECEAVVSYSDGGRAELTIRTRATRKARAVPIILAQSLPKGDKMDAIIRQVVELGVRRIVPYRSARSIPRLSADKGAARVARWQRIAEESARQTGRAHIPQIDLILSFEALVRMSLPEGTCRLIFWEEEKEAGFREALRGIGETAAAYCLIVGPEGGLTADEVSQAREAGFRSVSLGRNVLKVETAAPAVVAMLQYEIGGLGAAAGETIPEEVS
jgi:16S rRNA (uracil1498-N3)-methyltransferase